MEGGTFERGSREDGGGRAGRQTRELDFRKMEKMVVREKENSNPAS